MTLAMPAAAPAGALPRRPQFRFFENIFLIGVSRTINTEVSHAQLRPLGAGMARRGVHFF